MKFISNMSIVLTIIMTSQLSYITASGNRFGGGSHGGGHAAGGAAAHNNNQQQQNAAKAGGVAMYNNNQQSQSAPLPASLGSQNNSATTTPTQSSTMQSPVAQTPVVNSQLPTQAGTILNQLQTHTDISPEPTNQQNVNNTQTAQNVVPLANTPEEKAVTAQQKQTIEDLQTIPSDRDEILEQLKTIDLEDRNTHTLLNLDSMNQLFNNFVYFKDFLIKNFSKDKMLRLAVEFINQIYPVEHAAITMTSSKTDMAPSVMEAPQNDYSAIENNSSSMHEQEQNQTEINMQPTEDQSMQPTEEQSQPSGDQSAPSDDFDQAAYDQYIASLAAEQDNQYGEDQSAQ